MTNLVLNFKNIYHIFREKSEKQQKRDAKKAEKQAKKAAHKTDVGQVSNVESGSGDNEPDHSVGKYGTREMNQSRDKPNIKLIDVEVLGAKLKEQDVWLRGRLHTSRAKGLLVFFICRIISCPKRVDVISFHPTLSLFLF